MMRSILRTADHDVWFDRLDRPFEFQSPFDREEFVLMLVVADQAVTSREQAALSRAFIRSGCRYAVCAGHRCSTWDDSIDIAHLETDPNFAPPEESFVMTTWHENQSPAEVAFFFARCTAFDQFVPERFLILFVGRDDETEREVVTEVRTLLGAVG